MSRRKIKPDPYVPPARGAWEHLPPDGPKGRAQIRFNFNVPAAEVDAIRLAHAAIKTARRPARRRGDMEAAGAAVLADPPREHAKRPWTVRLFYTSQGNEPLAADFHGYTEAEAHTHAGRWGRCWRADGKTPTPDVPGGYRLVTFPSEYLAITPDPEETP